MMAVWMVVMKVCEKVESLADAKVVYLVESWVYYWAEHLADEKDVKLVEQ
jgi:hypothetical protein